MTGENRPFRRLLVGNDVVDLERVRTRDPRIHERFLDRVLSHAERSTVDADPDWLWPIWAAKETAFKVATKVRGEAPVFAHRAFETTLRTTPGGWDGWVVWEDVRVRADVRRAPGVVHAVGVLDDPASPAVDSGPVVTDTLRVGLARMDAPAAPWSAPLEDLLERFTAAERDAIHRLESAAVRIAAREALAEVLGVEETRLEIVCAPGSTGRRPPHVRLDGRAAAADVSLSHDGPWIAWVCSLPDVAAG